MASTIVTVAGEAEIAGTPTKAGLYSFAIRATDSVTGLTVTTPVKIPVFSSALPVSLRHFEEEGQEPGNVFLEPEGERRGVIYGKAFMVSSGSFTCNVSKGRIDDPAVQGSGQRRHGLHRELRTGHEHL